MSDSLAGAIGKLEAAVDRLAAVARHVAEERAVRAEAEPAGVPPAEVAALSARLEATIARLRAALPDGVELPEGDLPEGDLAEGDLSDGDLPDGDLPDDMVAGGRGAGTGSGAGLAGGSGMTDRGRDGASRPAAGGRGDGSAEGGSPPRAGEG